MNSIYTNPKNFEYRFLNADGTGDTGVNLNGNYASPTEFKYVPDPGKVFHCRGLIIHLEVSGLRQFEFDEYVPGSPLLNGIKFAHKTNGVDNLIIPVPQIGTFKTIGEFGKYSRDAFSETARGNNNSYGYIYLNILSVFNRTLDIQENDEFVATLEDDFTGLDFHQISLVGTVEE